MENLQELRPKQEDIESSSSSSSTFASLQEVERRERFRNRSRMSLIANILTVAKDGVPRTHLMYKANLSHRMLSVYVTFLLERGFIEEKKNGDYIRPTVYVTTQLGLKYLEIYNSLLELADGLSVFMPFSS